MVRGGAQGRGGGLEQEEERMNGVGWGLGGGQEQEEKKMSCDTATHVVSCDTAAHLVSCATAVHVVSCDTATHVVSCATATHVVSCACYSHKQCVPYAAGALPPLHAHHHHHHALGGVTCQDGFTARTRALLQQLQRLLPQEPQGGEEGGGEGSLRGHGSKRRRADDGRVGEEGGEAHVDTHKVGHREPMAEHAWSIMTK